MTSAPTPGVGRQIEAREAAARVLRVRLRDQEFTIAAGNLPIRIKDRFIRETGRAVEWYFAPERLGDVALCGLWFLSRLIDGETLTWDQALDEWEAAGFTGDDVEVIEDDGQGNDPEA